MPIKLYTTPCKKLIINHPPPPHFANLETLTRQELKILKLAAEDLSNQEIADKLVVSVRTIRKHRENIYHKFAICGKTEVRRFLRRVQKYFELKNQI
ncbi:MAG: response regulator transcription factor [Emticicia sp.]|uniref:response regulator transcription factor n=1 Tax=Emticicia sp. TaxID=1930953 RepID=UPI003BA5778E